MATIAMAAPTSSAAHPPSATRRFATVFEMNPRAPQETGTSLAPTTIDAYVASVPADARNALGAVIGRVRAGAIGAEEKISYKMAAFHFASGRPIFVAAWKKHISLHAVPRFGEEFEARLAPYRASKDTVRLPLNRPIPLDLVDDIVAEMQAGVEGDSSAA